MEYTAYEVKLALRAEVESKSCPELNDPGITLARSAPSPLPRPPDGRPRRSDCMHYLIGT